MFAEFVLNTFNCVTNTHLLHLQSRSYSEHIALGDFYEGLEDLVDGLVEAYQGKYGLILDYPSVTHEVPKMSALAYLEATSNYLAEERTKEYYPQDSELQNITDEIQALIDSTIYKLRYLK